MREHELAVMRAAIASKSRELKRHPADDSTREALAVLRRDYRAAQVMKHVESIVADAPAFTEEQVGRLTVLLARRTSLAACGDAA